MLIFEFGHNVRAIALIGGVYHKSLISIHPIGPFFANYHRYRRACVVVTIFSLYFHYLARNLHTENVCKI